MKIIVSNYLWSVNLLNGGNEMPAIKFDEKHRAEGLYALILQGDVYCLPDHLFVVPKSSLDCLD